MSKRTLFFIHSKEKKEKAPLSKIESRKTPKMMRRFAIVTLICLLQTTMGDASSECIMLIGGTVLEVLESGKPIVFYHPDNKHCSKPQATNVAKSQVGQDSSGCAFVDAVVTRETAAHPPMRYETSGGLLSATALFGSTGAGFPTVAASSFSVLTSPTECLSCGGRRRGKSTVEMTSRCMTYSRDGRNEWQNTTTELPVRLRRAAAAVVGDRLYVTGGSHKYTAASKGVYSCPLKTNVWTKIGGMLEAREQHAVIALSNTELLVCGGRGPLSFGFNLGVGRATDSCEIYDTVANVWLVAGSMRNARSAFALVNFNNKIYAIGGFNVEEVEWYDRVNDQWMLAKQKLRHHRSHFVGVAWPPTAADNVIGGKGSTRARHRPPPPPTTTTSATTTRAPTTTDEAREITWWLIPLILVMLLLLKLLCCCSVIACVLCGKRQKECKDERQLNSEEEANEDVE